MIKWSVELSEFRVTFEARQTIKAQCLAYFIAEMTLGVSEPCSKWIVHVDRSSNAKGSGAGLLLENDDGLIVEFSLGFSFPTSNNQAEYEACLAGLTFARDFRAEEVKLKTDSQLVVSQINGEYQAKDPFLQKYLALVKKKMNDFVAVEITHVPREQNT